MGEDFAGNAVPLALARHGVVVGGLAGLPTYSRANSLSQFYFVNGRAVRDKVLLGAVRAAYADFLFRDRFPAIAVFLAVDPGEVDVNVHPTKAELRFRDAGGVRSAVIRAVGEALAAAGFRAASTVADDVMAAFRVPETVGAAAPYAGAPVGTAQGFAEPADAPVSRFDSGAGLAGFSEPSARYEAPAPTNDATFPLGGGAGADVRELHRGAERRQPAAGRPARGA